MKKIAIIGAGPSGICTAKELSRIKDVTIKIFEKTNALGGVFSSTNAYKGLELVNNPFLVAFSDFPIRDDFDNLMMPKAEEYCLYLERYAKKFNVFDLISFNTKVLNVKKSEDGVKWNLTSQKDGETFTEEFCYVVVCSGVHSTPQTIEIPGQEKFSGKILHSSGVKDFKLFKGKNVTLVGSGEYSSDIAFSISKEAQSTCVSVRRWPGYIIPRYHDGKPTDLDTSRLHHSLLKDDSADSSIFLKLKRLLEYCQLKSNDSKGIQRLANQLNKQCNAGPFRRTTNKSEKLVRAILENSVQLKPKISSIIENKVTFEDGTNFDCDYIVMCTGFRVDFPFLEGSIQKKSSNIREMFKYMIPSGVNNMAFIGFIRPGVGAIPPMSEMQARYLGLILDGSKKIPSYSKFRKSINTQLEKDMKQYPFDAHRVTGLTDYVSFLEDMAREIGCHLRYSRLLLSPRLLYKVMTSTFCVAQYRLYGKYNNKYASSEILKKLPGSRSLNLIILFIAFITMKARMSFKKIILKK